MVAFKMNTMELSAFLTAFPALGAFPFEGVRQVQVLDQSDWRRKLKPAPNKITTVDADGNLELFYDGGGHCVIVPPLDEIDGDFIVLEFDDGLAKVVAK